MTQLFISFEILLSSLNQNLLDHPVHSKLDWDTTLYYSSCLTLHFESFVKVPKDVSRMGGHFAAAADDVAHMPKIIFLFFHKKVK